MEPRSYADFNSSYPNGLDGAAAEPFNSQEGDGVECLKIAMLRRNVAVCTRVKAKRDRPYIRDGGVTGCVSNRTDGSA